MMGLGDINLGEIGLDDMSRISMVNIELNMNNDNNIAQPIQNPPSMQNQKIESKPFANIQSEPLIQKASS